MHKGIFIAMALLACCGGAVARAPAVTDLVERAEARVEDGSVDAVRDLAPLLDALRTSANEGDQRSLIGAVDELGAADGGSSAAVKAWFVANAPAVLLEVARGKANWSVRGDALMALRSLDISDGVLDQAIAIARADTSEQRGYIHSRGDLLLEWKQSRKRGDGKLAPPQPSDVGKEQQALAFLRERGVGVSVDSFKTAVADGEVEAVTALLDAGIDVNAPVGELNAFTYATQTACATKEAGIAAQLVVIDELVQRGVDVNKADTLGNTALIGAVQSCPRAVIEKMLAVGAQPDPVNAQGFTPLKMALVSGHWDITEALIDKGARLTKKDADQLFFEPPQDPAQRALLARAIKGRK